MVKSKTLKKSRAQKKSGAQKKSDFMAEIFDVIKLPLLILLILIVLDSVFRQIPFISNIITIVSLLIAGYVGWSGV